jgi:beta-hydroxylase
VRLAPAAQTVAIRLDNADLGHKNAAGVGGLFMSFSLVALAALALYSLGSAAYVYRWRGRTRWAGLTQYLRKAWPIFAPLNCVLYMTTRPWARGPVAATDKLPNLALLRDNWQVIRDEALALQSGGAFEAAKAEGSVGSYDLGFRTFFKRGWSKFYLTWYGVTHRSAQRACPRTVALLKQVPEVKGAMFTVLPAGSELTLHADPLACSLRYHLGLRTPNSDQCMIQVDGVPLSWRDGQDFIFDETYPHQARNDTGESRLILMCDVARPLNVFGRAFNAAYGLLAAGTLVPNTDEDQRGVISALFAALAPISARSKALKQTDIRRYKLIKHTVNAALLLVVTAGVYGLFVLAEAATDALI